MVLPQTRPRDTCRGLDRSVDWEAARREEKTGGEAGAEFELLRLYDVVKTREVTTLEDLEAALAELRRAVQAALETGKRVILG
jgi:hypothetical protein